MRLATTAGSSTTASGRRLSRRALQQKPHRQRRWAASNATAGRGVELGLERVVQVLAACGNPEAGLAGRAVHVGGTNGKGSVCAMVFAGLRQAGVTAGLFTSPHLVEPVDAVRLARAGSEGPVDAARWLSLQAEVTAAATANGLDPTGFEVQVVAALRLFEQEEVEVAVIEVGLGGAGDATNSLHAPAAVAITNISLDHTDLLGDTVKSIAKQKAGIFKAGSPVFIAAPGSERPSAEVPSDPKSRYAPPAPHDLLARLAGKAGASEINWVRPAKLHPHAVPGATKGAGEGVPGPQLLQFPGLGDRAVALPLQVRLSAPDRHAPLAADPLLAICRGSSSARTPHLPSSYSSSSAATRRLRGPDRTGRCTALGALPGC